MKMRKNFVPIFLVLLMTGSIAGAIIFKNWLCMYVAAQMIMFHFLPPFAIILSVIAYKSRGGFWFNQTGKIFRSLAIVDFAFCVVCGDSYSFCDYPAV